VFNQSRCLCRFIRPEVCILAKREKKSENTAAAATRTTLHISRCARGHAEIVEPANVSKPAECRNYSLRCTLCSGFSVHPFRYSPSRRCPVLRSSRSRMRARFPSLSLSFSLRHFGSISMGSLDLLYLAYPAATIPHLHALIPVHTSERIRYGRAYRARATFTLHNAGVLCFFLCAATVTSFRECAERHTVLSP